MDGYQAVIDRTRIVKRMIVPLMSDDPIPGRKRRHALNEWDAGLVMEGRACSECLAAWEDVVLLQCPICRHERSAEDILDTAADWEEYLRYVKHELANPTRTVTPRMDQMVDELSAEALEGHLPGVKRNL